MKAIRCIWEHNGEDTLLYAADFVGAYTRGETQEAAKAKMPDEIRSYCKWSETDIPYGFDIEIVQEKESELHICDADSDVLFEAEKAALTEFGYEQLKHLALKSAEDFLQLYNSIPDKNAVASQKRKTFYGDVPRSASEMYEHTKNVNAYYFAEIEVDADNNGDILECRKRGFELLEMKKNFLLNTVFDGSYGEEWSLRKVLRRFIWHDRIHAKAMWRLGVQLFGENNIANPFYFADK
ncbi:MAG: hypothetical protein E7335_04980 [Clostridiales bacterium]|nr:hypothetical protein [Clostridiales bacterium]